MPGSFGILHGHFGERAGFAAGLGAGILLGDFQPEPDGFADVYERFRLRFSLAPAARQRGAGDGKPLLRRDENHRIFHGSKLGPNEWGFKGITEWAARLTPCARSLKPDHIPILLSSISRAI
jgi:hypothetical protein